MSGYVGSLWMTYHGNHTFNYASQAGNTLLLLQSTTFNGAPTDSAGNTWTKIGDNSAAGATTQYEIMAYACANAAAITTITVNATSNFGAYLVELDVGAESAYSGTYHTGSSAGGEASVTAPSGGLVVAACAYYGTTFNTPLPSAGFTNLAAGDGVSVGSLIMGCAYADNQDGPVACTWTPRGQYNTGYSEIAFNAVPASGPVVYRLDASGVLTAVTITPLT